MHWDSNTIVLLIIAVEIALVYARLGQKKA